MPTDGLLGSLSGPAALPWVLIVHALSTLAMMGLIWFVQVVHYPLLRLIPTEAFASYEQSHTRRTTVVVAPLMLLEIVSTALLWAHRDALNGHLLLAGTILLAVVWLSTFAVQVPMHARLERGKDARIIDRLVASNWIRTIAWTLRGAVSLLLFLGAGSP